MEAKSENHGKVGPGWKPKGTVKKPGFLGGLSYHFDLATALYMLDGGEKFLIHAFTIGSTSLIAYTVYRFWGPALLGNMAY